MFLIDTDVLSALRRRERSPAIVQWLSDQRPTDLYLSVVSIGEIERGIVRQHTVTLRLPKCWRFGWTACLRCMASGF